MQFRIPCETYVRLSHAAGKEAPLNCVRIESKYAVATDRKIMSVQQLDEEFGESINVIIDNLIVAVCEVEALSDADLIIDKIDGVPWATARTSSGWAYQGNALLPVEPGTIWDKWRQFVPYAAADQPYGILFTDMHTISRLAKTAPSGRLIFPKFIDTRVFVVVRDSVDPSWFGVFSPIEQGNPPRTAATVPEWFTA